MIYFKFFAKMKLNYLVLKIKKPLFVAILLVVGGLSFYSCFDDKFDLHKISTAYQADPRLAITIGTAVFNIDSILTHLDSTLSIRQTDSGLIYVVYEKNIQFYKGEDKFLVPTQNSWNTSLPSLPANFPPGGTISITVDTFHIPVSFGSDQIIDSINIKKLLLSTNVHSTYNHPSTLTFTFPSLVKNNAPFTQVYNILAGNYTNSQQSDAAGYFLKFTNASAGVSYLNVKVDFTMTGTAGSPVDPGTLDMGITVDSLKYHALYGYAGYRNLLNVTDSINIPILDQNLITNVQWANPSLKLLVKNSYVVLPIRFNVSNMATDAMNITIDPSINPKDLNYPSNLGSVVNDSIVYTKSNTNMFQAFEQKAKYIKFHCDAWSNPLKNTSIENIIVDTSSLKINAQFYLPIWFRSGGFGTTDTMSFDLQKSLGNGLDSIQYMLFRIVSENGMPVDMKLQILFVDESYKVLTTMYKTDSMILIGGVLDQDGRVISPTRKVMDATFNANELKAMKNTKKLLIKLFLNSAQWNKNNANNSPYVKFYSDYTFKLSFAFKFQGKFRGYF